MRSRCAKLYKIVLIGYIIQLVVFASGLFVNKSASFYFQFTFMLWGIGMILNGAQYEIFCKLFEYEYGNVENFRKIQQDNGARLRKYKNIHLGGYNNFMLDMQFNKTIIITCDDLNYMRKYLYIPFVLPIIEFIMIILMITLKVVLKVVI